MKANEIKEQLRKEKLKVRKQKSSSEKVSTKGHVGPNDFHESHEVVYDQGDNEVRFKSHKNEFDQRRENTNFVVESE